MYKTVADIVTYRKQLHITAEYRERAMRLSDFLTWVGLKTNKIM